MQWIRTDLCLPPLGLKVLCFRNGDCWTAYRFSYKKNNIWIAAVPNCNLKERRQFKMGRCQEPEYWCEIPFEQLPGKYTGKMFLQVEGDENLYDMDDFVKKYPKEHDDFIKNFIHEKPDGKRNEKS